MRYPASFSTALALLSAALVPSASFSAEDSTPHSCDCAVPVELMLAGESATRETGFWVGEEIHLKYGWSFGNYSSCKPYSRPQWGGLGYCGRPGTSDWTPEIWWAIAQDGNALSLSPCVDVSYSTECNGQPSSGTITLSKTIQFKRPDVSVVVVKNDPPAITKGHPAHLGADGVSGVLWLAVQIVNGDDHGPTGGLFWSQVVSMNGKRHVLSPPPVHWECVDFSNRQDGTFAYQPMQAYQGPGTVIEFKDSTFQPLAGLDALQYEQEFKLKLIHSPACSSVFRLLYSNTWRSKVCVVKPPGENWGYCAASEQTVSDEQEPANEVVNDEGLEPAPTSNGGWATCTVTSFP